MKWFNTSPRVRPTQLSQYGFKLGLRAGIGRNSMPSDSRIEQNCLVNLLSRSVGVRRHASDVDAARVDVDEKQYVIDERAA